jgi:hypothetical protein
MQRAAWWVVSLAVPLVLVAVNIRMLASEAYLVWEYGRAGFPAAPGFGDAERLAVAVPSTRFIVTGMDRDVLDGLRHGGAPLYAREEVDHLVDVRVFVRRLTWLGVLGGAAILGAFLATAVAPGAGGCRRRAWRRALGRGGALTVGLVLVVGAGIAAAWPVVFTGFHELFFPAGTWQFPVDSGLIRLFPGQFWYDVAVVFSSLTLLEGVVVALIGRVDRGRP